MLVPELHSDGISSLSARRAWIEISANALPITSPTVALRKESVDRNFYKQKAGSSEDVALRKESVDRNWLWNVSLSDCSGWFCSCGYPL